MPRVDLHIVRGPRGWKLQNANERTLAIFRSAEAALEHGEARGRQLRIRGLNVRVTVHEPGRTPKVFEYPAQAAVVESYALARCCLS
jgi:hypothetical protein